MLLRLFADPRCAQAKTITLEVFQRNGAAIRLYERLGFQVAETRDELLKLIEEAIQFHIEGLREDGLPIPAPSSSVEFVEVRAA